MPVSIYSNISSLQAQSHLGEAQMRHQDHMGRLAAGLRVRDAAADAAGLGISTQFAAQIRSYAQAERNANDGVSLLQTAEGALGQIHGILLRMRELTIQSANGTYSNSDRANISAEMVELQREIDRIATSTRFGNVQVLQANTTVTLQVGVNNSSADQIVVTLGAADANTLTVDVGGLNVSTQTAAQVALNRIDNAISAISTQRSNVGALQNRIRVANANDQAFRMNLSAATSRIRDADVAEETAAVARAGVLVQAGVAVLAQANQAPQLALSLLRG